MKGRAAATEMAVRAPRIDADAARRDPAWAPFRVRSFRFQWPADLLTCWAFEMETLILGWYVLVETDSVLLLTLFASLQFLGTLTAPTFGVLGDRIGRRSMLCGMRALYTGLAVVVLGLYHANVLAPAWVIGIAMVSGVVRPSDLVMRNALIGDTIPPRQLTGAMSLARMTMDSARVAGAIAGAWLFSLLGIGAAYVFVTCFYVAGLLLTLGVSRGTPGDAVESARPPRFTPWRDLVDGLTYVWTTPRLLGSMWLAFLVNLTGYPVTNGLLPYVAKTVYHVDQNGLSHLIAAFAAGALLGSGTMVATGWPRHADRATLVGVVIWYLLLLVFVHVEQMALGLVVLVLAGVAQAVAMICMSVTLLNTSDSAFRGRVMGVRTLAVYGLPLGLILAGWLIPQAGYAATMTGFAAIGLLFTVVIGVRWRAELWHRRDQSA